MKAGCRRPDAGMPDAGKPDNRGAGCRAAGCMVVRHRDAADIAVEMKV